jgi:hypothetical protein
MTRISTPVNQAEQPVQAKFVALDAAIRLVPSESLTLPDSAAGVLSSPCEEGKEEGRRGMGTGSPEDLHREGITDYAENPTI